MGSRMHSRRAARGANVVFTAVNFGAVSLFNPVSPMVLRVWLLIAGEQSFYTTDLSYKNGRLSNHNQGVITSLFPGDGVPPGVIDTDDLTVLPPADFYCFPMAPTPLGQGNPYPFALVSPGWSLVVAAEIVAQIMQISFLWDWVYPDELISPNIGDPDIDL